jgi:hypothetical protein
MTKNYKFLALAAMVCIANALFSATRTWTGNTSTSWSTGTNWSGNTAPTSSDSIIINSGSPRYPSLTGSTTVAKFTITGGTLNISNNSFRSNTSFNMSGGTVTTGSGTITVISNFNISGGTYTKTSGNTNVSIDVNISGGTFNAGSGGLNIGDDMIMTGGILNAGGAGIDINDDFTMSLGTLNASTSDITSGSVITINGGTVNAGTASLTSVDMYLTGGTVNIAGNGIFVSDDMFLNGATLNILTANLVVEDDFFIQSGTMDLNNYSMTVTDELTYEGGTITNAGDFDVDDLNLDLTGTWTLGSNIKINTSADFILGIVKTSTSSMLVFAHNASVSNAKNSSHASGPVRRLVNTSGNTTFDFPIGNGSVYAPIGISDFSQQRSQDYFTAQYDMSYAPYNHASKDNTIDHISAAEYWVLDRAATSGTPNTDVNVRLSFNETNRSGDVNSSSHLRVVRWDGTKWVDHGASNGTGNNVSGTVRTTNRVTDFSPFTLGSTSSLTALPVSLLDFNAVPLNRDVKLTWSTTAEINNDFYAVERSLDGINWQLIGHVESMENPAQLNQYSFMDHQPVIGIQYYRLVQTDLDGQKHLSKIARVNFVNGNQPVAVSAYPNPAGNQVTLDLSYTTTEGSITLYNAMGVKVMEIQHFDGNSLTLDVSTLESGIYTVEVRHDRGVYISKILKH